MRVLTDVGDLLETAFGYLLAALFAALIIVVFAQVFARNVMQIPLIWTLDLAQLLFSWCIFVGAALAFRNGAHYLVDLWPQQGALDWIPTLASALASIVVIGVLVVNGFEMSRIGMNRVSPALGISGFWFFIPIPLGGVLMALFLIEQIARIALSGARR